MSKFMGIRRRRSGLVLSLGLLALAARIAGGMEIKLAHPVPDGSLWDKVLDEMGAEWRDATNGRVKLIVFAGGVAGPDDTVVRKLRLGQLHAASLSYIGLTTLDKAFEVFTIPLFFKTYDEFFCVLDALEPVLKQRLEAKEMILLSWGLGGWAYFFTKDPVQAVPDIKQMRMFTAAGDPEMVEILHRNGFRPVALASTDIMSGLQSGMFDALPTAPLAALAFQWYRTISYMHEVGLGPVVGATVITKRAWDQIPEQHRSIILQSSQKAEATLREEIPTQEGKAVQEMKRRGLRVTTSVDPLEWQLEADRLSHSMRGSVVPSAILGQALAARKACRQLTSSADMPVAEKPDGDFPR